MRNSIWLDVALKSESVVLKSERPNEASPCLPMKCRAIHTERRSILKPGLADACLVVMLLIGQAGGVMAAEVRSEINKDISPILGDRNYKLDQKYSPIYGSPRGKSFFLHYCVPGFVPRRLGSCELGQAPGSDPNIVQVHYKYSLDGHEATSSRLEGGGAFLFPFPVNADIEGKTPYVSQYKNRSEAASKAGRWIFKSQDGSGNRYEGLDLYESSASSGVWWVPRDVDEYKTRLGNPPIFVCKNTQCYLTLDQGNGWIVTAVFNEQNLSGWRDFFVQLNDSIKNIMEQ